MGKVKASLVNFRGKFGDDVIVQGMRDEAHTRNVVEEGSKKMEPHFKKQYERVGLINKLASQINKAMEAYSQGLKSRHFYPRLLKLFRNEPVDNRFLMLQQLKGKEVNDDYAFSRFYLPVVKVELTAKLIVVTLQVEFHSQNYKYGSDCYYFEPVVMQWGAGKELPNTISKFSQWVSIKGKRPVFEFKFRRVPELKHWLLALRLSFGKAEQELEVKVSQAMQIVEVGTTLASDLAILKKREKERARQQRNKKKADAGKKRVKAKKFR